MYQIDRFFFGEQRLLGAWHAPLGAPRGQSVLFCAPLFYEYFRSQTLINQAAIALANEGFSVLRFDYSGTGDSSGNFPDNLFDTWTSDISLAAGELVSLAANDEIITVAFRFSAQLAGAAFPGNQKILAVDAVGDPLSYWEELSIMHTENLNHHTQLTGEERKKADEDDFLGLGLSQEKVRQQLMEMSVESSAPASCIQTELEWVDEETNVIIQPNLVTQIVEHCKCLS